MPELRFSVEWPDHQITTHYSPSTLVREFFQAGAHMSVEDLMERSRQAFARADQRVQERYGFTCSGAAESLRQILARAEAYRPEESVKILDVG